MNTLWLPLGCSKSSTVEGTVEGDVEGGVVGFNMTAGTVRLITSTRSTEKGTRTESEIVSPEACTAGRAGNWGRK